MWEAIWMVIAVGQTLWKNTAVTSCGSVASGGAVVPRLPSQTKLFRFIDTCHENRGFQIIQEWPQN
jgi:hypothetical protein